MGRCYFFFLETSLRHRTVLSPAAESGALAAHPALDARAGVVHAPRHKHRHDLSRAAVAPIGEQPPPAQRDDEEAHEEARPPQHESCETQIAERDLGARVKPRGAHGVELRGLRDALEEEPEKNHHDVEAVAVDPLLRGQPIVRGEGFERALALAPEEEAPGAAAQHAHGVVLVEEPHVPVGRVPDPPQKRGLGPVPEMASPQKAQNDGGPNEVLAVLQRVVLDVLVRTDGHGRVGLSGDDVGLGERGRGRELRPPPREKREGPPEGEDRVDLRRLVLEGGVRAKREQKEAPDGPDRKEGDVRLRRGLGDSRVAVLRGGLSPGPPARESVGEAAQHRGGEERDAPGPVVGLAVVRHFQGRLVLLQRTHVPNILDRCVLGGHAF